MAEEFAVKVTLSPQTTDLNSKIQSALDKKQFAVKSVRIDSFNADTAIAALKTRVQAQLSNIEIGVTYTSGTSSKNSGDKNAAKQLAADAAAAQKTLSSLTASYNTFYKNVTGKLGSSGTVAPVKNLTSAYQGLMSVQKDVASGNAEVIQSVVNGTNSMVSQYQQAYKGATQYQSALKQLQSAEQQLSTLQNLGVISSQDAAKVSSELEQARAQVDQLSTSGKSFDQTMASVKTTLNGAAKEAKNYSTDMTAVGDAISQIDALLSSGTITNQASVASLSSLREQLVAIQNSSGYTTAQLKSITSQIEQIGGVTPSVTSKVQALSQQLKTMLSGRLTTMVVTSAIRKIGEACREVISTVEDLNSAMTQLEIVTGSTTSEMAAFFEEASAAAKEYGSSISDVLSSIETFARLGYNMEDALEMTNAATVMANVGNTSVDDATTGITSIVKAYSLDADDAEQVTDELVAVGQSYAISAAELMEAFEAGGSSLSAANNTLEESMALFAAGNASIQNASKVGTALKTTAARIRSSTAELDEMGEEYDDLVASASDYRAEILALSGVDIMADEN